MVLKINQHEQDALEGLPYFQQVLYYAGIRPYMDYATGIVGRKRRISYQSLSEKLYVEPHKGYTSGSPCKTKIRRALLGLERAGLISKLEGPSTLIFECPLAERDFSAQNKVGTQSAPKVGIESASKRSVLSSGLDAVSEKADTPKSSKAGTPPVSGNKFIKKYINPSFTLSEKFRQKAQAQNLEGYNDEKILLDFIDFHQSRGTQSCDWEAEFFRWLRIREKYQLQEKKNEPGKNPSPQRRSGSVPIVERVKQANRELLGYPSGRIIEG